ncbi:hypothetical protein SOVF_068080 isoform B [Spinacia oleracea]|nr:hypothetical protein SOVF_068080 isoform B [Spinacia oleracea]
MEELEEEGSNGFNDWESLPSTHNRHNHHPPSSSASSHKRPPLQTTLSHHHHNHDHHRHLAIFPPINHEGLPIPPLPPPHAPLSLSNCNSDTDSPSSSPSPPPPKPQNSQLIKWFDFALHLWNFKLRSSLNQLRSRGLFSSILPVATTASVLAVLWFWVRRRRRQPLRRHGGTESIEHLKLVIKEKDEKIIQLLEQIALMNKVLLTRYKIPVSRAS